MVFSQRASGVAAGIPAVSKNQDLVAQAPPPAAHGDWDSVVAELVAAWTKRSKEG